MNRNRDGTLLNYRRPLPRFARSINVERDGDGSALDSYFPVGRALDVVHRLAGLLLESGTERALSVTGPYGSGKSSLGLLIDALLSPSTSTTSQRAFALLGEVSPETEKLLKTALTSWGAEQSGFIRCVVTAQRESVAKTVVRGLRHGLQRYTPAAEQRSAHRKALLRADGTQEQLDGRPDSRPDTRTIRELLREISALAPVVVLIDEFGKNLEAFADSRSEADLFLLQDLAEWSRGTAGIPLVLITMQHMAFDDYAAQSPQSQRREWSKIQGRFEDLPFVDSPEQTRALVGAAFETASDHAFDKALQAWSTKMAQDLRRLGLNDIADPGLLQQCWPLHPVTLLVLPDLCHRYGQNERTLFGFLAGSDARAVPAWLGRQASTLEERLPAVLFDTVYEFFIQSATSLAGTSSAANRWLEIDVRIRDAHGLTAAQRRVVRAVGVLNLVSSGGSLRASQDLICWAAADGNDGTFDEAAVARRLQELDHLGLVTYRDFADEFRIWQGSDFDIKSAVDAARQRLTHEPVAVLLSSVLPLPAAVAARHSHETGTLRTFQRLWVGATTRKLLAPTAKDPTDGLVLYALDEVAEDVVTWEPGDKPVVLVQPRDPASLRQVALEVAALQQVLRDSGLGKDDWVVRRELTERVAEAFARLDQAFETDFGTAASDSRWSQLSEGGWVSLGGRRGSVALSMVADAAYHMAPRVQNDLLNKRELTSQAAKARRTLLVAMVERGSSERLGITGFGPERAMYEAVLARPGIHQVIDGVGGFGRPPSSSTYRYVWDHLTRTIHGATRKRIQVDDLYDELTLPPYGIRAGMAPVLLMGVLLTYAGQVAIYEHGTYRPTLTAEVVERLLRNPGHFEVKHFATRSGPRSEVVSTIDHIFRRTEKGELSSLLGAVSGVVSVAMGLPFYSKQTKRLRKDSRAVRACLLTATEPDRLLFEQLPTALGLDPIPADGLSPAFSAQRYAQALKRACEDISGAYDSLLAEFRASMAESLGAPPNEHLRSNVAERARMLQDLLADQNMRTFVAALTAEIDGEREWIEYVAMMIAGTPPESWSDDDRRRALTLLQDVAGTFTRLSALHHTRLAEGGAVPFDAFRMALTRTDGHEDVRLLAIDEPRRRELEEILRPLIDAEATRAGSFSAARDEFLAALAQMTPAATTASSQKNSSQRREGAV